jgi:ribosomal 50S subunit-associated protein YjgA (DUF615 family)
VCVSTLLFYHKGEKEMLIIPKKSTTSKLEQLITLRKRLAEIEELIDEIMPSAIDEALDKIANSNNQNNIVYGNKTQGKIVVNFRKQYPSIRDNVTLQRLDEDIKAETLKIEKSNQSQLSELTEQIANLTKEIEQLKNSPRLGKLKARFLEEREKGVELLPLLSVYLNK